MTTLEQFVSPALTRALGWTLLHSLWQGALVAAVLAGALLLLRRQRAEVRYAASAGALGVVVALAGITFGLYFNSSPTQNALLSPGTVETQPTMPLRQMETSAAGVSAALKATGNTVTAAANTVHLRLVATAAGSPTARPSTSGWLATGLRYFDNNLPLLVVAWLLGLLAMSLRMLGGLLYVQRLRNYRVRPLSAAWQERLAALAARSGVKRPVALLESALVRVPLVVGHLRPVILLPLGTVAGLSPACLEAILAHELAHVLRRDYLVNLLQTVAEVLFFYHPAVWFMANCVRTERENCCDDTATALVGGDPLRLARALTALAEWSQSAVVPAAPRLALAAMNRPGALLLRVRRLVQRRPAAPTLGEGLLAGALVLGGLGLLGSSVALAGPLAKATLPTVRRLMHPALANSLAPRSQQPQPTAAFPTAADTIRDTRPADPGTVVITRDKKGRLTSLMVNGQPVAVPTDKPSKAERRAGQQVTVVPVSEAGPGRRIVYSTRVLDQAGRENDREGRRLDDHARELDRAGRELDKAGRKLDKMGREMDQEARKLDRKSGTYTYDSNRRAGDINSNVHIDIDDAALGQLVTNALKLGNVGLNIGLQAASQGLDEARRALETTLRDPSLSDEARRATRDALTELRQEERHSSSRQSADRTQEARDRRQELQDRIRESQQELRDLEQDRADRSRDQADRSRDRADRDRDRNDALVSQMQKDGLLKDPDHYQIKLTARALVIDGKEQSAKVFQKYLKLYESNTGRKLTGNNAMVITRNSDSSTIINNDFDGPTPPRPPRAPLAPRMAPPMPPMPPIAAPPAPPAPPRVDSEELRNELRKDGIIGADEKNLQFQLNAAGLTVNGKKQSDELADKYRKLTGHADGKTFNMMISTQE
ncbi:bla regulator protein BlaR1 [Hymenobacter sp. UYAg731]